MELWKIKNLISYKEVVKDANIWEDKVSNKIQSKILFLRDLAYSRNENVQIVAKLFVSPAHYSK